MTKVVFFQRKPKPFHKSIESIFHEVRENAPARFITIPYVFKCYSSGVLNRIRILFEAWDKQADINHITGDIHFAALLLSKRKTILTIHDCGVLKYTKDFNKCIIKYLWFIFPAKRVSFITVVSDFTKVELLKIVAFPEDRIRVIPVSISNKFIANYRTFNNICPVILQVGTAINKNLLRLIQATIGLNCHIHIIGIIPPEVGLALNMGKFSWSNSIDLTEEELIEQYKQSDIIAFVSEYEGFGMPILEAQATGRPVITSNSSSMPYVAGDAACFVDPFDILDIRRGLLRIINDDFYRNEIVQNGFQNVLRFNVKDISAKYYQLYDELLASNNV